MKWPYFVGAAMFSAYCLLRIGVPLLPILFGCLLAGMVSWYQWRGSRIRGHGK